MTDYIEADSPSSDEQANQNQKFNVGELVELFELDLTDLGGEVLYFTAQAEPEGGSLQWRGNTYVQVPIEAEGFELSASGQLPRPTLRLSNVLKIASSAMVAYNNLVGGTVTRWRVYETYLDNGATPDPDIHFPVDVYRIDRKSSHNALFVEWELAAELDQEGLELPRRQCLKSVCTHVYRSFNTDTGQFDYSKTTCPYVGGSFFNSKGGAVADAINDKCSKSLETGCKARFGDGNLPFRGFPGMSRGR